MPLETRNYALGTSVTVGYPWGLYASAKALCADGKVRTVKRIASTADTFFSVPASVEVRRPWSDLSYTERVAILNAGGEPKGQRHTVAGYITFDTVSGSSVCTPDDPEIVRFIAYSYGKSGHLLPGTGRPVAA